MAKHQILWLQTEGLDIYDLQPVSLQTISPWRDGWKHALGLAVIVARSIQELQKSIWVSNSSSRFWKTTWDGWILDMSIIHPSIHPSI